MQFYQLFASYEIKFPSWGEEYKLQQFEDRVLRKISGLIRDGTWGKESNA
jgi:hypothetical protein